ncbi:LysR substrate-binding domain-containing protein [Pseudomonas [fluorescens] ATCC 17400]
MLNAVTHYQVDYPDLALVLALVRGGTLARAAALLRLTCTDSVLQGLLLPALARFMPGYPALTLELSTSNSFANLSRRDADIALRLTRTPAEHLVGRCLGTVSYRVCASPGYAQQQHDIQDLASLAWIAPDDFLPDHPTVAWRRQHLPGVRPSYRCNSMLSATELVRAGLGVAALPDFLLGEGHGLQPLGPALAGHNTALWLLTRPDCRALRSVVTLFDELGQHLRHPS